MARSRKAVEGDTNTTPQQVVTTKEDEANPVARWKTEIELAAKHFRPWQERGEKVVKRYRDERDATQDQRRKFNLLWSNVQTLGPALYSRTPKVQVSRRFNDADKVGRVASQILERGVEYELEKYDIAAVMKPAVQDRLLPGWGIAWVRYEPHFQTVTPPPKADGTVLPPQQEKAWECTPIDYIYWRDFLVSPARMWEETRWVARRTFPSRAQLNKRFGEQIGKEIPLTSKPQGFEEKDTVGRELQRGEIWEIWDREAKKVYWVATGYDKFCDERDDPLKLENFFPCPKPLLATTTTGTLIPVPDYAEYQDQAQELDDITERIASLTKSLKVVGLYDKSVPELQRVLNEGYENQMVPVDSWAAFAEKGGLKGSVDFLPMEQVINTITALYSARAQVKSDCYEITGMADIVRGASDPNETATAQKIKGRFASLRLSDLQSDVERFARDVIRIKAEIMSEQYAPETLIQISGILGTPEFTQPPKELLQPPPIPPNTPPEMQQQAQQMAQQQMQQGIEKWKQENQQILAQAIALLKSQQYRDLRIDIETQSMAQMDQDSEKQTRTEFMTAVSGFLQQAGGLIQVAPQATELMAELLRFGVHGFPVGREMEGVIDRFVESMQGAGGQGDPKAQQAQQQAQQQTAIDKAKVEGAQQMIPLQKDLAQKEVENTTLKSQMKLKDASQAIIGQVQGMVDQHTQKVGQLIQAAKAQPGIDVEGEVSKSHQELIAHIGELVKSIQGAVQSP